MKLTAIFASMLVSVGVFAADNEGPDEHTNLGGHNRSR